MEKSQKSESLESWESLPEGYRQRFGGISRLYGVAAAVKFFQGTVTVIGIGGVGSWVVEALARSGVGALNIIDLDDVCITNVNRQLPAMDGEIGRAKIEVMAERVRRINPDCRLRCVPVFISPTNLGEILPLESTGVVVDCIDRASVKVALLAYCHTNGLPCLTVGGAGGRVDSTAVRVADLTRTEGDPLLKQVRKQLRRKHRLPRFVEKKLGIPCVFSTEHLRFPTESGSCSPTAEPGLSLRMDCASGFGAATHVTGAFGFAAAGEALKMLSS